MKSENTMDKNVTMQSVEANELSAIEGGVGVGIFTGNMGEYNALQKNGASVGLPTLGGPNSYYPSGGGIVRGDGYGSGDYQEGTIHP
jgi:hypothetical protein